MNEEPVCFHHRLKARLILKMNQARSYLRLNLCFSMIELCLILNLNYKQFCTICSRMAIASLFQKLVMTILPLYLYFNRLQRPAVTTTCCNGYLVVTTLLCLCSASIALPIDLLNPPFGNPLTLSYKNLVFLISIADLLNATVGTSLTLSQGKAAHVHE